MFVPRVGILVFVWATSVCSVGAIAAEVRADIRTAINTMRGVKVSTDQAINEATNKRLDSAWKFLRSNANEAATALRAEITADVRKGSPDPFFMFDAADLLQVIDGNNAHDFIVDSLLTVDPFDAVIKANSAQWVRLLHRLGKKPSPATLQLLDRFALANRQPLQFFDAPHWVSLDAVLIGVFLYGVGGSGAETHLLKQLNSTSDAITVSLILSMLIYLGTETSTTQIKELIEKPGTDANLAFTGAIVLLRNGGVVGKEAFLRFDANRLSGEAREFALKLREEARTTNFPTALKKLESYSSFSSKGQIQLSDSEIRNRLQKMIDAPGSDHDTPAAAVAKSNIPRAELVSLLMQVRSRALYRLNNHAIDEVRQINLILNALRLKNEK
jgi:hypothetical protein